MTEYACPRRELSCIVGNLFVELEPPCDHCAAGDSLTICGTTYAGTRATLTVTEYGFTFDGPPEEVEQIRERFSQAHVYDDKRTEISEEVPLHHRKPLA